MVSYPAQFRAEDFLLTITFVLDTWSLTDKAKLAVSSNMAGCATWSLDQVRRFIHSFFVHVLMYALQLQDDGITLHNAIRKGLGK